MASATRSVVRLAVFLALIALAVAIFLDQGTFRDAEAGTEGWLIRTFSGSPATVIPERAIIWTGRSPNVWGFQVTGECSAALLVAGFAILGAVLIAVRRHRPHSALLGAVLAMTVVVGANLVRISVVVAATLRWGDTGFEWSHTYVGSAITLIGLMVAAVAFLAVTSHGGARGDASRPDPQRADGA